MTYEEALSHVIHGRYVIADEVILDALQKQIPKPKHKSCQQIRCVCGCVVARYQDYCNECGQKLLPYEGKLTMWEMRNKE